MSLARIMETGSWTVRIFTAGTDPRGDRDQGTWADGETFDAWYTPSTTSEALGGRDTTVVDQMVMLPASALGVVTPATRGRDGDGREFTVDGEPYVARRPGTGAHHLEVKIRAVV